MRLAFVGFFTVAAALAADVQPSAAQHNAAFCLVNSGGRGSGIPDCSYRTLAQCRASIAGGGYHCTENPNYSGPRQGSGTQGRRQRDY
jgi:Protein of unknown function (DUF3551)